MGSKKYQLYYQKPHCCLPKSQEQGSRRIQNPELLLGTVILREGLSLDTTRHILMFLKCTTLLYSNYKSAKRKGVLKVEHQKDLKNNLKKEVV